MTALFFKKLNKLAYILRVEFSRDYIRFCAISITFSSILIITVSDRYIKTCIAVTCSHHFDAECRLSYFKEIFSSIQEENANGSGK